MRTVLACLAIAACPGALGESARPTQSRVALVIGNAAYKESPLINPVNDARALGAALRAAGFEVIELHDQGSAAMRRATREFGEKLRGKDAGLFYFAGHGVQVRGRNYLVPVDADIKYEDEIEDQSVEIGLVLAKMESAKARVNLVILDACRNNPFARSNRSAQNGLAAMEAPIGTLVAFATSPGQVASDGMKGNGLYTSYLVREMTQPGLKVEDVFKRVRASVRLASAGRQIPWENTSLEGDFYFRNAPVVDTAAIEREQQRRQEDAIQQAVATALTRSREESEQEKRRLETFYAQKMEAERAALRKEAGERIAALEKAALAVTKPQVETAQVVALAQPVRLPPADAPAPTATVTALASPVPPPRPVPDEPKPAGVAPRQEPKTEEPAAAAAGESKDEPAEPNEPAGEGSERDAMTASVLVALGIDPALRNQLKPVADDVARALKRALPAVGDTWTYYRTIRDGEGVERRNYVTRTVTFVDAGGFTESQSDAAQPARFDIDGNQFSGTLRTGTQVVYDPVDAVFRFPLEPGQRWDAKQRELVAGLATDVASTITVGGWEEVSVTAGKFRAIKVSKVSSRRSEPFPGQSQSSKRVSSYWYVPALRAIAKFEGLEVTDRGAVIFDQGWELDSFELR